MSDDDDTGGGKKKLAAILNKPTSLKVWHVLVIALTAFVAGWLL